MVSIDIKRQTSVLFEPVKLDQDYGFALPAHTWELMIPVDQQVNLNAFLHEKPGNDYLLLYFQGNAENMQNFLDNHSMVFDWGYNILVSDYRGFGKSGGELKGQEQLYHDAIKVYCTAIGLGYKPEQIILYGYSMGVAMACYLAANFPARAIIMESGYSSVDEMEFSAGLCPDYAFNNAELAKNITIPALITHGELDAVITKDHAERLWNSLGSVVKDIFILPGGGHGDLRSREEYQRIINGFTVHLLKYIHRDPVLNPV